MNLTDASENGSIEQDLVTFIQARGPQFSDVTVESDLLDSGLLDSLLLIDLIFYVEGRYSLRFDAGSVGPATFRTMARLANVVRLKMKPAK